MTLRFTIRLSHLSALITERRNFGKSDFRELPSRTAQLDQHGMDDVDAKEKWLKSKHFSQTAGCFGARNQRYRKQQSGRVDMGSSLSNQKMRPKPSRLPGNIFWTCGNKDQVEG